MYDSEQSSAYRGPAIPNSLGERLRLALGLDERPKTFGEWVSAMIRIAERDDIDVDLDMLCTTADSPHKARFNGKTQHYQCVQDPIIAPFLADEVNTVEIETRSPVRSEAIQLTVTESGIEADPTETLFSFGVAADVEEPPEDVSSPVLAYRLFCPYGHAFSSREAYDAWADDVDAITMATSVNDTFELSRAVGEAVR